VKLALSGLAERDAQTKCLAVQTAAHAQVAVAGIPAAVIIVILIVAVFVLVVTVIA